MASKTVMSKADNFIVTMECGHTRMLRLDQMEECTDAYCPKCATYKSITTFTNVAMGYRFRCEDCHYARTYGLGKLSRDTAGSSHALRKRHRVVMMYQGRIERVVDYRQNGEQLTLDDVPPF